MRATLTSKGQSTVPKAIRDRLHLHPGDQIEFAVREDGRIEILAAPIPVASLKGILPPPSRSVSLADMDQAIRKRAAKLGSDWIPTCSSGIS